jgi:hypothetical protein
MIQPLTFMGVFMSSLINILDNAPITAAIDQVQAHGSTSSRYRFISTRDAVNAFERQGFTVAKYQQGYVRNADKQGYQRHVVNMRPTDTKLLKVGDSELRVIITNSHCGSSCLTLSLGLYRLVCSNGLVVGQGTFESVKVRHIGKDLDLQVAEYIERITIAAEELRGVVSRMQGKELSRFEQVVFAKEIIEKRFTEEQRAARPNLIADVLQARRVEDSSNSVWSVYNRVQENIVRGFTSSDDGKAVRGIKAIDRDIKLNQELWTMAMAA